MSTDAAASPAAPGDRIAIAIARALIGEAPTPEEIQRWHAALERRGLPLLRSRDRALWDRMVRSPGLIGPIDAALALCDPHSPVRQRLFLMLAVLEASPAHVKRFIPGDEGPGALLSLVPRGALAVLRTAAGLAVLAALPRDGR